MERQRLDPQCDLGLNWNIHTQQWEKAAPIRDRLQLPATAAPVRQRISLPPVVNEEEVRFDKAWHKYVNLLVATNDISKIVQARKFTLYLDGEFQKMKPGVTTVFSTDIHTPILTFGSREKFCEIIEMYNG